MVALEPAGRVHQKVNRGGGAKPGNDGVPAPKSGGPEAAPPPRMKSGRGKGVGSVARILMWGGSGAVSGLVDDRRRLHPGGGKADERSEQ